MTLFLLVLLAALVFEYINGFHDTANAIATVVSTKVLTPRAAIVWAAFWNLVGALAGTAVAKTISGGLVDASAVNMVTVLSALCAGTTSGAFKDLPEWASFLRVTEFKGIPFWVVITCALTMAAGTAAGGWRIIRTMGHKMVKMQPVHGFAAETTAALIIHGAST